MSFENKSSSSHLHSGRIGPFLLKQQPLVVSWVAKTIHRPSEVSRKAFSRSPMVPFDSVVALCMTLHWQHLAVGDLWLQMFIFLLKKEESPLPSEKLCWSGGQQPERSTWSCFSQTQAECTICNDLKTEQLNCHTHLSSLEMMRFKAIFFWAVKSMMSDFLKIYSPLCSPTHFSNPFLPVMAPG